MNEKWKIELDLTVGRRLRNAVNSDVNLSVRHKQTLKGNKASSEKKGAWNRICAIMDRIDAIAEHINSMQIIRERNTRCAFEFLDLLNHSAVLVDCVYEIARLYNVNMDSYSNSSEVFHQLGTEGKGTDRKYYEYLRSVCAMHPFQTDRHKQFQGSDFECCPYVRWSDAGMREKCDLYAQIYLNKEGWEHYKDILIHMDEVVCYIQKMYRALDDVVIPGIYACLEEKRKEFRQCILKKPEEFASYLEYLRYLGEAGQERLGCDLTYYCVDVCRFFQVDFQEPKNKRLLTKYRNALKLAIGFHHNCIQNMSYDGYDNTGIQCMEEDEGTTLLDCVLGLDSYSDESNQWAYAFEKSYELVSDNAMDAHAFFAKAVLEPAHPFIEKFVSLKEATTDEKYYVLIQLARYAECLRSGNENALNRNLPNELSYRIRRLSDSAWMKLHEPRVVDETFDLDAIIRQLMEGEEELDD